MPKLTDALLRKTEFTTSGQRHLRDTVQPGFFVVIGKQSITFTAQVDVRSLGRRRTVKKKLGRFPEMSTDDARKRARSFIGQHQTGERRAFEPSEDVTLRAAWADLKGDLTSKEKRSRHTILQYEDCINRLLKDWLDENLIALGNNRPLVKRKHDELTREHGPYAANRALQCFRAVYNNARRLYTLPDNPVVAITFNAEHRRQSGMGPTDLPAWFKKLDALSNPVRREFHLFVLLSGSRVGALKCARWEHLDVRRRALFFPAPKGGEERAFHMPLSRAMLKCLCRARRAGRRLHAEHAKTWIFPADTPTGHIAETKEKPKVLPKHGHDLRHSYRTLAAAAGIDRLFVKLMMNHALSGDVTDGYVTGGALFKQVKTEQERLSRFILQAARETAPQAQVVAPLQRHARAA